MRDRPLQAMTLFCIHAFDLDPEVKDINCGERLLKGVISKAVESVFQIGSRSHLGFRLKFIPKQMISNSCILTQF